MAGAFSLGLLAVVPGELCRVVGSLPLSMALAAVGFALVAILERGVGEVARAERALAMKRPAWPALLIGALGFACVVDGAITRNFFDEEHHVPMAMVIARGIVPPEHPLVPGQIIPYHWGIDALYAQLAVAGLRPDNAIDVVTILSWPLLLGAAALFGSAFAGKRGATLAMILAPLAGSPFAWPLHDGMGILQLTSHYPKSWIDWTHRPPPLTADFFQHPQGLAFPLVLVIITLWCASSSTSTSRKALAALLLACLSLIQAIHFLVLGFGLFAASLSYVVVDRAGRRFARDIAWLALALVLAVLCGGFFAPGASTASTLLWNTDFFADTSFGERVVHHLAIFGLPLLLLPLAWRLERVGRVLVLGAAIGFFLPNVVTYAGSWDIVKLYSAGGFLAGAAVALTLANALASTVVSVSKRRLRTAAVAVCTALTLWFPLAWMASRTILQGHLEVPKKVDWRLRDDVLAVGRAAWPLIPAHSRVLVGDPELARMNGLLSPGFDPKRYANGHMLDFAKARRLQSARDVAMKTLDPVAIEQLDVDYALLLKRE
ncbi:MAG TPA: hypothetical protein VGO62_00535, partial [Myxococcota bacterium]